MGCLKKLTICVTGALEAKPDQLKKWIEANDGRWVPKMSKGVTHLIASEVAWKTENEAVTAAKAMNIPIITYDWLEDCLQTKKRLNEKRYLLNTLHDERKKTKQMKRVSMLADTIKFEKGTEQAAEDIGSGTSKSSCKSISPPKACASPRVQDGRTVTDHGNAFFKSSMNNLKALRARREREAAAKAAGVDLTTTETSESPKDKSKIIPGLSTTGSINETKDVIMHDAPNQRHAERPRYKKGSEKVEGEEIPSHTTVLSSSQAQASTASSRTSDPAASLASIIAQTVSKTSRPPVAPPPKPENPKTEKLTDHYHIFLDSSGFEYNISLIRSNLVRSCSAKYNIRLFESHTAPHMYCTYARYTPIPKDTIPRVLSNGIPIISDLNKGKPKGKGRTVHPKMAAAIATVGQTAPGEERGTKSKTDEPYCTLLVPMGSDFNTAFTTFRTAFRELTFLTWEERLLPLSDLRNVQKARAKHLALEPFVYAQPKIGLPKGTTPEMPLAPMTLAELGTQTLGLPGMDVKINEEYAIGRILFREVEEAKAIYEQEKELRNRPKSTGGLRPYHANKAVSTPTSRSRPHPNAAAGHGPVGDVRGNERVDPRMMMMGMEMVNREDKGIWRPYSRGDYV